MFFYLVGRIVWTFIAVWLLVTVLVWLGVKATIAVTIVLSCYVLYVAFTVWRAYEQAVSLQRRAVWTREVLQRDIVNARSRVLR